VNQRVALVTGAGSGIGLACVERLASHGLRVAALDVDARAAEACGARFGALPVTADVSEEGEVVAAVERVLLELGQIDVAANVAGITGSRAAAECHVTPVGEWTRVIAVNLTGPFLVCRAVLPHMLARRVGVIVNIASVAGLVAFPGRCAYTASKGGVVQLTRSIAADYAARGIRANAICPGMVDTPMTRWRLEDPELGPQALAKIPQGRVAKPQEIAEVVGLLATGTMPYANGSTIVLDGAFSAI
jgi:NAD(P)-dependent dehydrogenase (short-subunit alcohol dehydrogenase family)